MKLHRYCILLIILLTNSVFAQEREERDKLKPGYLLNAHLGSFLPNQIEGVTEVLPMWGAGYAISSRSGYIELGGLVGNGSGVRYYDVYVEARGDFPVEDLIVTSSIGLDAHMYAPPQTILDPNPKEKVFGGGHVSGGMLAHIADNLWFKIFMKFNVNPGTSLYFGFGFEIRPPKGEDKEPNKEET